MKTPLNIGTKIVLAEAGTSKETEFTITELIGAGASCIVYTAVQEDGEGNKYSVRLKEFYPNGMDIKRNGTALVISDDDKFSQLLAYFTSGYQKQLEFRQNPAQMNSISNIQGVYTGNNTKYIAMSCNAGACLTAEDDYTFTEIMRIICAVTKQIAAFHESDYLYLDMKPNNIFLYPETLDMIMLFDFDSVISKENVRKHSEWLSYTEEWSAPELSGNRLNKIDERADIYSIGALLLFLLFKRKPSLSDRRRWASWDKDIANSILAFESPENIRLVTDILKKTLCTSTDSRFKSCYDILDIVDPYLESFLAPKPYLKTSLPIGNNFFCGRDEEIADIHDKLQNGTSFLMLHGIGGIGKSELAKHYAAGHSADYDAAVFVRFNKDIMHTVVSDTNFPVVNCKRSEEEKDEEYFQRKMQILQDICTPRHRIILDNFDTEDCDNLDILTKLNCKILVTSRVDYSDVFEQIDVGVLNSYESITMLFTHYWKGEADEYIKNIIYALEGHTMGVELTARQMQIAGISSKEMYERLSAKGISSTDDKIRNFKDGNISSKSALKHIEILFSVFELSEDLQYVLGFLSMIGTTPISEEDLFALCDFDEDSKMFLYDAIQSGWVQSADTNLQLHPLICEALLSQLKPDIEDVWQLIKNLEEGADDIDELPAEQRYQREKIMHHVSKHIYGEPVILVAFLRKMEKVFVGWKEYAEAEQCLLKRMELSEEVWPDSPEEFRFEYFDLADYAREQGEFERAENYMKIANELVSEDQLLTAKYFSSFLEGDYETAKEYALELLKYAETTKEYYKVYNYLADAEELIDGDSEQVIQYGCKELYYALECMKNITYNDPDTECELLSNIADAYMHIKDYDNAVRYYLDAIKLIDKKDDDNLFCKYLSLGQAYALSYSKKNAIKILGKSCKLIEKHYLPQHPEYTEKIELIANICNRCYLECDDDAYLYKSLEMLELLLNAAKDKEELGLMEIRYADTLLLLPDKYEECEEHLYKALDYFASVYNEDDYEWIDVLTVVWQLLMQCGNSEWKEYFERTVSLCMINEREDLAEENYRLLDMYAEDDDMQE